MVETGFFKEIRIGFGATTSNGDQPGIAGLWNFTWLSRELIPVHIGQSDVDHAGVRSLSVGSPRRGLMTLSVSPVR
jgi:hypothetical protein